jgi:hypothetical protein
MSEDETIACCFEPWKREIYAAELRRRPFEEGRAAA